MTDFWSNITILGALGYLLTLVLIRWVLLTKKRQPASTVAWMIVIIMLPFLGGVLFLIFGINRVERRAAGKQQAGRIIARSFPALSQYQLMPRESHNPQQERLMRLAHRVSDTVATVGNKVELLVDTNRTLGLIEQAVRSANKTLHLEYYIWKADRTGTRLRDRMNSTAE